MKPLTKLIFGTLLVLGVASCATAPRESAVSDSSEEATIMSGELEAQFTSDHLTKDRLDALELRAQQKLLDFADYVTLISNQHIDSTFSQQAKEQTRQLFVHPQPLVTLDDDNFSLEDFFSKIKQEEAVSYVVQDINVIKPLKPTSDKQYVGEMIFSQPSVARGQKIVYQRKVDIWVKKVDKQFGNEQKKVWEVFLGNIE